MLDTVIDHIKAIYSYIMFKLNYNSPKYRYESSYQTETVLETELSDSSRFDYNKY